MRPPYPIPDPPPAPTALDALSVARVRVSEHLVGAKRAILLGGSLYVSPAMHALMRDTTPAELRRVLDAIPVLDLGPDPFTHHAMAYQLTTLCGLPGLPGPGRAAPLFAEDWRGVTCPDCWAARDGRHDC